MSGINKEALLLGTALLASQLIAPSDVPERLLKYQDNEALKLVRNLFIVWLSTRSMEVAFLVTGGFYLLMGAMVDTDRDDSSRPHRREFDFSVELNGDGGVIKQ
jgi:hypothetical protein